MASDLCNLVLSHELDGCLKSSMHKINLFRSQFVMTMLEEAGIKNNLLFFASTSMSEHGLRQPMLPQLQLMTLKKLISTEEAYIR